MSKPGNTLPRRDALPPVEKSWYVTGETALDICRMLDLRLDDGGFFIDVGRLDHWTQLRVMWTLIGGHYYCNCNRVEEKPPEVVEHWTLAEEHPADALIRRIRAQLGQLS